MSIQQIRDDLVQDLIESGRFDASEISTCSYNILDRCGTCALVLQPAHSTMEVGAYGPDMDYTWQVSIETYIREGMDPTDAMQRAWQAYDDIDYAIKSGSCLNGPPNRLAYISSFEKPRLAYAEIGGHTFIPVFTTVTVRE